jgi:putative redox protein
MNVTITRVNDRVHLRATNPEGNTVDIDGSPGIGGENAGFRPMQLLLASLASCSAMDVITILEKQRQRLDDISITVSGDRKDGAPSPFTAIRIHYDLYGAIDEKRARRSVDLAVHKYCSVGEMLKAAVDITATVAVNPDTPGGST